MANYNYRWPPKKQKKKAEKNLISFIKKKVAKYSPFYRDWFKKHGIDPSAIKRIEDFKKIPPVTKKEHMENPTAFILQPNVPDWWESKFDTASITAWQRFYYWRKTQFKSYFRSIFGKEPMVEEERIRTEAANEWLPVHFHSTVASEEPALIAYTKHDLTKLVPEIAAQIYLTGFRTDWEVFNLVPASPDVSFFQSAWTPLSVGGGTFFTCGEEMTPIEKQIKIAEELPFEVFLGTPSYISYWLRTAIEKLKSKEIEPITGLKLCLLTGEPLTQEFKKQIKDLFGELGSTPAILESYSNNRMKVSFTECSEDSGIHLNPRYFYWEVLDTKTLEPVEEGEKGFLCFSHIDWRGTVFIRYNTGDVIERLEWETCGKCGLTFPKIITPIFRSESDFLKINKKRVSRMKLENSIRNLEGVKAFQIIIKKKKAVEVFVNADKEKVRKLKEAIVTQIDNLTGITPTVIFEDLKSIKDRLFSRGLLKAELIIVE